MFENKILKTQVLIIGGGITGAGLARDLALRDIRCILIEKQDINAGASGANHGHRRAPVDQAAATRGDDYRRGWK